MVINIVLSIIFPFTRLEPSLKGYGQILHGALHEIQCYEILIQRKKIKIWDKLLLCNSFHSYCNEETYRSKWEITVTFWKDSNVNSLSQKLRYMFLTWFSFLIKPEDPYLNTRSRSIFKCKSFEVDKLIAEI
jgi:hypothetical protein